nr:EOG090X017N [Cyclestheria hislopi]
MKIILAYLFIILAEMSHEKEVKPVVIGATLSIEDSIENSHPLHTKTVYGFLDFVTTVSNTVMVFKPSKDPGKEILPTAKESLSRTPSILLSKAAKIPVVQAKNSGPKIKSHPPIFHFSSTIGIENLFQSDNKPSEITETIIKAPVTSRGTKQDHSPVHIEGSIIHIEDVTQPSSRMATERLNRNKPSELNSGTGFIVSSFPVVPEKIQVAVSSRVDVRIGGISKITRSSISKPGLSTNHALPKQVEVRMELNVNSKTENRNRAILPSKTENIANGKTIITKTSSTIIRNGLTTIHETSVFGTTINGKSAQIVHTTSQVFRESASIEPTIARGVVEVVTELPSFNAVSHRSPTQIKTTPKTTDQQQQQQQPQRPKPVSSVQFKQPVTPNNPVKLNVAKEEVGHSVVKELIRKEELSSLPSLESLFDSVSSEERHQVAGQSSSNESENLPEPQTLVHEKDESIQEEESSQHTILQSRKDEHVEDDDDESPAITLKPSFRLSPSTIQDSKKPSINPSTTARQLSTYTALQNSNKGQFERRTGVASSLRQRIQENSNPVTPRPFRRDGTRWRYSPSPKPKVPIIRPDHHRPTNIPPAEDNHGFQSNSETDSSQGSRDEDIEIEPTEVKTLRVQTITPTGYKNLYYELATVKSPYVMRLGSVRNTRYVTMTRTLTRLVTPTPPPVETTQEVEPDILLDASLPLTENILATTNQYENILKGSSDTSTLPAIIVAATESESVSLETVTETFSTTELMMKTSILPYLKGGMTSHMTLTQSYYITRLITAIKTVPPTDLYQFIPSKTLKDISTNLQEAGSEHNEHLLPGELEFSENDEFEDDPNHEKRVPAPPGLFDSDLSSIGSSFDPSSMEKQIELQPSLISTAESTESSGKRGTPPLPNAAKLKPGSSDIEPSSQPQGFGAQETPALTAEQLQQLALFRFMNPYAAAGLPFGYPGLPGGLPGFGGIGSADGGVQIIQTSRPVVKTTDIVTTNVLPIWDGAKTIYSTITRTLGTTVVTETEFGTTTVSLPTVANPFQQYTVVSTPVVTEIMTTSTELRIYRIIFRAQTTYTTVTSTTVVPTLVTTYVSSTIRIQPTAFPGLFPGSFGFPGLVG